MRRWLGPLAIAVLAFALGFQVGFGRAQIFRPSIASIPGLVAAFQHRSHPVDFGVFSTVWDQIQKRYVNRPVSDQQLLDGALKGLVEATGDPYSAYLDPKVAKEFENDIKGDFEGIGAEIGMKKDHLVVIAPLPDSPAAKAGLKSGDAILSINGQTTQSMTLDAAVAQLRGKAGSKVSLIAQTNTDSPRTVEITRAKIQVKSVTLSWADGAAGKGPIAVVIVSSFSQDSGRLFASVTQEALTKNPSGFLIDLRNNPGGYLDQAVDIASEFIASGPIVTERFGDGKEKSYPATGSAPLRDFPVAVLMNSGSASAAEILAGALHEVRNAPLIGEQSFGKGSVQELESLPGGANLKLTVAHWLTPKGNTIEKNGLTPDHPIALTKDDYENDRDPQRDAGLKLLRGETP